MMKLRSKRTLFVAIQTVNSRLRKSQDIEDIIDIELRRGAKRTSGYEGEFDSRTEFEYQAIDHNGFLEFYEDGMPVMLTKISAYYKIPLEPASDRLEQATIEKGNQ